MKNLRQTVRWILGIILIAYIGIISMLNIPYIQHKVSVLLSTQLSKTLNSELTIKKVSLGILNRVIIDDLVLNDQSNEEMLRISRLSAKLDILPLLRGRVSISTVQLFGFHVNLYQDSLQKASNLQFLIDALSSPNNTKRPNDIDIRINSLLARRGKLSYHVLSELQTPGIFNAHHLELNHIGANISLKALRKDSINAAIKRLSVTDSHSGFTLKRLDLKLRANNREMNIENFRIALPHSELSMDTIRLQYHNLEELKTLSENMVFSFHLLPSNITPTDLAAFVPALKPFKENVEIEIKANGNINQLNCSHFSVTSQPHFHLRGNVELQDLLHPKSTYIYGNLSTLYADSKGISFLLRNLAPSHKGFPSLLQRLNNISFKGEISGYFSDMVAYGLVSSDLGNIRTDIKISSNRESGLFSYSGEIKTANLKLGDILSDNKIGETTFNLEVKGEHGVNKAPEVYLKGLVSFIEYNNYTYENITLDGKYQQGGFDGKITLTDQNGSIDIDGNLNTSTHPPTFNFSANINKVRPHDLHLSKVHEDSEISLKLKANFSGSSVDDMNGEVNIDSLNLKTTEKEYFLDNLKVIASQADGGQKRLIIQSDILQASVTGNYSYQTLPESFFHILRNYISDFSGTNKQNNQTKNNFTFDINIFNTDLPAALFNLPLHIHTHSVIKGYFNDDAQRLRIEGYFPRIRYKDRLIESGVLLCENPNDEFHTRLRFNNRENSGDISISLDVHAKENRLKTILNWGNSGQQTYSGRLASTCLFIRDTHTEKSQKRTLHTQKLPLKAIIDIEHTHAILNDTLWEVHPSRIVIDSGKVHIDNFRFGSHDRYLRVNGTASASLQDTVKLDLKGINIGYVFDIADLGITFQGEATGSGFACNVMNKPVMHTDLYINNFGIFDGPLGEAKIHGEWHNENEGIYLDAKIRERSPGHERIQPPLTNEEFLSGKDRAKDIARTHVHGYIYPLKPKSALDLQIDADNTNLKFIETFMTDITPDFNGRASGNIHFYGGFKSLTMDGKVSGDASIQIDILNTTLFIKDSILVEPGGLTFRNNRILDTQGKEGRLNGFLHYNHFKNLDYRFHIDINNMLVMNTKENHEMPFYGTIYGTGDALISGNEESGLNVDASIRTEQNSNFVYVKDNVSSAANNQFIRFIDKTSHRTNIDSIPLSSGLNPEMNEHKTNNTDNKDEIDIRLNLHVEATPDATMKIIMDPVAGDYISGKGNGNIRTEFYNKADDVRMFGNYRITQGVYKFSLQEIIRKDFTIQNGSSINFNGAPLDAILDIEAYHTVNSASLNDLMSNATDYVSQTNVKVNCTMSLNGQLTSPDIKLGLLLPNERDEVQALVRNYIPTEEQMNMQILYLLSIGKFYTPENTDGSQNSSMMSSVLSSTLSGQLNNALSSIINSSNWNFGTNFSTGEKGWTDVEVEGILTGQLLNNRLLINGNFGYRDNPLANTSFVGDFEAEWLVTRNGDIRLKAYNQTNDRYYTKTNLTTQGIGILFKKDFDYWKELIFWNKRKLRKLQNKTY